MEYEAPLATLRLAISMPRYPLPLPYLRRNFIHVYALQIMFQSLQSFLARRGLYGVWLVNQEK
jgi:hypothetical protein